MGTPAGDTNRTAGELGQFRAGFTRGFWISRHEVTQSEYQNLTTRFARDSIGRPR